MNIEQYWRGESLLRCLIAISILVANDDGNSGFERITATNYITSSLWLSVQKISKNCLYLYLLQFRRRESFSLVALIWKKVCFFLFFFIFCLLVCFWESSFGCWESWRGLEKDKEIKSFSSCSALFKSRLS